MPPGFAKAKADLNAAAKLATGVVQASTGASATTPLTGSDGEPDYTESVKQLRTRHSQLAAASPAGMTSRSSSTRIDLTDLSVLC